MHDGDTVLLPMSMYHIGDVSELENACFSDPWSYDMLACELNNPLAHYFVLLANGTCVGYGGGICVCDEFEITTIAVAASFRRRGFGAQLLSGLIECARSLGAETMHLEVRASNQAAIDLYRRFGFRQTGRRRGYYTLPKEDALLMTLALSTPPVSA